MMSYAAALQFLYGLQKHGVKLGLETISALLARIGDPQHRYRVFHIGGTNGKGSTAAMVASVLHAAGYRVGLYTSPHLMAFNERIRVDGHVIADERIAELTGRLRDGAGTAFEPTFFELTTALAFQYFAESGVDAAVVEVGMGGRWDATNVVSPIASAITNVDLDHQAYLGDTVEAIAFEKAGIIKPDTPVVGGRLLSDAAGVIEAVASERKASIYRLGADFRVVGDSTSNFHYEGVMRTLNDLSCPLPGRHQLDNAACALALLELAAAQGLHTPDTAIRSGLAGVHWEGRLEAVERRPLVLLDGAHNPAAGKALADYLVRFRADHSESRVILVVGMMRDKDHRGFFQPLLPVADEVVLCTVQLDRAASVSHLRGAMSNPNGIAHEAPTLSEGLTLARRLASPDDVICVTGSLMLVGEVKALLRGCVVSSLRG